MNATRLVRLWAIQARAFAALVAAERVTAPGGSIELARIDRRRRRARVRARRAERLIARELRRAGAGPGARRGGGSIAALDVAALVG